jgi:hypothetical protein
MCLVIGSRLDHIIPNALHCSGVGVGSRGSFWNIKDPAFCCNHYSMLTKHSIHVSASAERIWSRDSRQWGRLTMSVRVADPCVWAATYPL